ncbi:MBL fold metallo-hydrolase [Roseisalinus antarcticus]|uniref:Metallo-beta-lactamase superfamily protein n=1 Tax=Roseisalinus antarcticus TaxID=254357 RepID=A0A1Y5S7M3_9RHOB|nr:MBL fold metallo-hydrolase [Roseisalinus antarcticus]SLN34185.1 Metallo-beta-lactamase superfamily protein [Roseisalinus antarcticus]
MSDTSTPIRPVIQRFRLGEAWVTTILDGAQLREPLRPPFMMDKDDAALQAIASENRLPWDQFENTYTPVVVELGGEVVLIDTGFGPGGRNAGAGMLRERLGQAGYGPEDITVVAFTHSHPDHIAGVMEGDTLAYPNARHVIGRVEFDAWKSGEGIPESRAANRDLFLKVIAPLEDQLTFVAEGQSVVPGIVAEEAFGHSLGHMMYRVTSGGQEALIWGDVTNHYAFSLRHPDSPVGFDDDKPQAIETRKRVLAMVADAGTLVIGHHMPFPAVGHVERDGDSYAWRPATYQLWI